MRIVAIVQARLGSTRLPEKVLQDLDGQPMLWRIVTRARAAQMVALCGVATSDSPLDDAIADFCAENKIPCFRGSQDDVLARFHDAAQTWEADAIVRLTADCPLIDPQIIDAVCEKFASGEYDYLSNTLYSQFPDGLDVEIFTRGALQTAFECATKAAEREHVTPYLRNSGEFRLGNIPSLFPSYTRSWRLTVDDPADMEWMRQLYHLMNQVPLPERYNTQTVIDMLDSNPQLRDAMPDTISNQGYFRSLYEAASTAAVPSLRLENSTSWYERAKNLIPGVAQTFSKGPNQYVRGVAPLFLESGKGCRVWDVDGNEYIDYVQGLLPNILGYAHPEVNAAAHAQAERGHSFSLPHPSEVELAEKLVEIIPCAEMVRFGKNGSDATSGAVRVARAFTGRERIAYCGYHGWQDWFIGATTRNAGVPVAVRELTQAFKYNDISSLQTLLESHDGEFAAVIMEPFNFVEPHPGYLEAVKELAHRHGAVLIFDEICSGFHLGLGGAQRLFGVTPDLACFGKAMGNGWPISAVVGRADIMRVFEDSFFSFTFSGEAASIAAARKVIDILENTDSLARQEASGRRLQDGFNALAGYAGLSSRFACVGRPQWSLLKFFDDQGNDSFLERSLWSQEIVKRGVLQLVTHNVSAAHDEGAVERTLEIYAEVFKTLAGWLSDKEPERHLEGPLIQPVFRVR